MGLLVNATADKKILISGTDIEIPNVYVRLEYAARANGTTLEIAIATYASKQAFKDGAGAIFTDVQQGAFTVELQEGQGQDLTSAELYSKIGLENLGYSVEIEVVL
jgi:hypothetical protein